MALIESQRKAYFFIQTPENKVTHYINSRGCRQEQEHNILHVNFCIS